MRALVLVVVLTATGCVRAELQSCGDLLCTLDQVCLGGTRCVDPALLVGCGADVVDGTACDALGVPGRCLAGVCEPARCGDNVIDSVLREDCDGTAPSDGQCVALGYDLGRPACSDACRFDPTESCTRFGWQLIENVPSTDLWTDGTTFAYTQAVSDSLVVRGPTINVHDVNGGRFRQVRGGAGRVFALGMDAIVEAVGIALIEIEDPPGLGRILAIDVDDAGALYALGGCKVAKYAGGQWSAPSTAPPGPNTCTLLEVAPAADGHRVFIQGNQQVFEIIDGVATTMPQVPSSNIVELLFRDHELWVQYLGFTHPAGFGVMGGYPDTTVPTSLAVIDGIVYMTTNQGYVHRLARDRDFRSAMRSPTAGSLLTDDGHGNLYAYGGPIYRYAGSGFGELASVPLTGTPPDEITDIVRAQDGAVFALTRYVSRRLNLSYAVWQNVTGGGIAIAARSAADYVILGADLRTLTTPSGSTFAPLPPGVYGDDIWMAEDGTLFAGGYSTDGGWLGVSSSTTWTSTNLPPGCHVRSVHGTSLTNVVAAGTCEDHGVVWRYAAGTWSELYRATAPDNELRGVLAIADGQVFAAGEGGTLRFDGTAWTLDPLAKGRSLAGADDDVWLSGQFTNIQHWDGTSWSQMATNAAGNNVVIAVLPDQVIFFGAATGRVELLRQPR